MGILNMIKTFWILSCKYKKSWQRKKTLALQFLNMIGKER